MKSIGFQANRVLCAHRRRSFVSAFVLFNNEIYIFLRIFQHFTIKLVITFWSILGTDKYIKIISFFLFGFLFLAIKNRHPVLKIGFKNLAERKKNQRVNKVKSTTWKSQEMNGFSLNDQSIYCYLSFVNSLFDVNSSMSMINDNFKSKLFNL